MSLIFLPIYKQKLTMLKTDELTSVTNKEWSTRLNGSVMNVQLPGVTNSANTPQS